MMGKKAEAGKTKKGSVILLNQRSHAKLKLIRMNIKK